MKEELRHWLDHQCMKCGSIVLINGNKDGFTCTITERNGKVYMGWSDASIEEAITRCKARMWVAEAIKKEDDITQ
jgi:hypothetical protein